MTFLTNHTNARGTTAGEECIIRLAIADQQIELAEESSTEGTALADLGVIDHQNAAAGLLDHALLDGTLGQRGLGHLAVKGNTAAGADHGVGKK